MKTPEQMAEEDADRIERQAILCVSLLAINDGEYFAAKKAYKAGYQAAKDEMDSSNNSNSWISVKDRLPEDGKVVLVAMPKGTVTLGGLHTKTQTWDVFLDMAIWTAQPTHWMPLPEAPEEK